ncbi:MAG: hypothetical protein GY811_27025 [Myxococcales bacterium]|nr:hypothetical protein [Myxococcales bacterium]
MEGLLRGFADFASAIPYLLARPKLLRLVVAPFLIALMIAALLLWWVSSVVDPWAHSAISYLPDFMSSIAGGALRVLLWGALLAIGYVAFLAFTSVLTTPFCEMLSEAIEEETTGEPAPLFSLPTLISDLGLGLVHSIRRLALLLASVLGFFLLSALVPIIGALAAVGLGAWFSARFAAYDCFDTVWARKGTSYGDKAAYLKANRGHTTGLGLAVAGTALIPLANALAFPLGAIAATRTYLDGP